MKTRKNSLTVIMKVNGVTLSENTLTNVDILKYVQQLQIPFFRGVFMRDTLPKKPYQKECGVMNLNKESQEGSHWVCWYKYHKLRIYFDSFGQHTPNELIQYLKTPSEYKNGKLCLFVLKLLTDKTYLYEKIIYKLQQQYAS